MLTSLSMMILHILGVAVLLLGFPLDVSATANFANAPRRVCGTHVTAEKAHAFERNFLELQKRQMVTIEPRTFDVCWTVIIVNETLEGGWISRETMDAQIEILNKDYAEAQISWRLTDVNYVKNGDWFENAMHQSPQERHMKYLFRKGDASVMNLYTLAFNGSSAVLGYSTMPQWLIDDPIVDGVVIKYTTMPGGSQPFYNIGRTLTHEVGHWLGLYHTFQGGCEGSGDFVDDTPAEAEASGGCPIGRDTCPGDDGEDPIHNFMDYSVDECMRRFTPGQIRRMHQLIQTFRQPTYQILNSPYTNEAPRP